MRTLVIENIRLFKNIEMLTPASIQTGGATSNIVDPGL
jgi:hypothetical protein